MKRVFISMIVVLVFSLAVSLFSMFLMRHVALEIEEMRIDTMKLVEAGDIDGAAISITQMAAMWKKHTPLMETITSHSVLHDVTCLIVEADANLSAQDLDDFNRSMMLLKVALEHLYIEEQFHVTNIL